MELNGMKFEIEHNVKQIHTFKVGEKIKVLKKDYSSYGIHLGMITNYDNFNGEDVVTIVYIEKGYNDAKIKIEYLTKDSEIKLLPYDEEIDFEKDKILDAFDEKIKEKEAETKKIKLEKEYFIKKFGELLK
ncbi:MAG: hypothetical protein KAX49_07360 [Halanaerobiales bacterium]|nr:hypothetical protein [Halanaerobiales bacterium]